MRQYGKSWCVLKFDDSRDAIGVPAITLCKLLGSTMRVVEQFYLRTSDANDKFAVDVLDRLMGDGEEWE